MTAHAPYKVNVNPDRPHVVHRYDSTEQCNVDDADKLFYVDKIEADELLSSGAAVTCEHCLENGLPE